LVLPLLLAVAICLVNTLTPMRDAVAVLYVLVVMLVADVSGRRMIGGTGLGCAVLAFLSFLFKHWGEAPDGAYVRLAVSLVAIAVATLLAMRARHARVRLVEQIKLLALTHDTVIVRDVDDTILDWNEGAARLYGWSRGDAIGRSAGELLQTRHQGGLPDLAPGGRWSGEITRVRSDGTPLLLSSRWLGRLDEDGRAAGIIELSADRTEQRAAEHARLQAQRRYAAMFHGTGVPIMEAQLADPEAGEPPHLVVRDGNEAAARLLGTERAALAGLDLSERLPLPDLPALQTALGRLQGGEEGVKCACGLRDRSSQMREVVLTITRAGAEESEHRLLLLTILDVTERNAAMRRLERARADLSHAARISALGQMTAAIAHEVNQPLQAMMTYARSAQRWLAHEPPDFQEASRCLQRIVTTTERAGQVVERVRAMVRRQPPVLRPLDLRALLAETLALLEEELRHYEVTVHAGGFHPSVTVKGDRTQLQQVVVNVVRNAIQAMTAQPRASRRLTVTVFAGPTLGSIQIDDDGPGFPPDQLVQAFDPFHSSKTDGFGIGLSVCRTIMEAHGGQIEAANLSEKGARVTITLPRT